MEGASSQKKSDSVVLAGILMHEGVFYSRYATAIVLTIAGSVGIGDKIMYLKEEWYAKFEPLYELAAMNGIPRAETTKSLQEAMRNLRRYGIVEAEYNVEHGILIVSISADYEPVNNALPRKPALDIPNAREYKLFKFDEWWAMYDKKVGDKEKIKAKFCSFSTLIVDSIMEATPKYVASTPDKAYRKNPATYLNQKGWEHEVVAKPTPQKPAAPAVKQYSPPAQEVSEDIRRRYERYSTGKSV